MLTRLEIYIIIGIIFVLVVVGYHDVSSNIACKEKGGTWFGGNIQLCVDVKEIKLK